MHTKKGATDLNHLAPSNTQKVMQKMIPENNAEKEGKKERMNEGKKERRKKKKELKLCGESWWRAISKEWKKPLRSELLSIAMVNFSNDQPFANETTSIFVIYTYSLPFAKYTEQKEIDRQRERKQLQTFAIPSLSVSRTRILFWRKIY